MNNGTMSERISQYIRWYFATGVSDGCPGEETLGEYVQGLLSDRSREAVERHCALCSRCGRTLCTVAALHATPEADHGMPVPQAAYDVLRGHIPRAPQPLVIRFFRRLVRQVGLMVRRLDSYISFHHPSLVYVRGRRQAISKNLIVVEKTFPNIRLVVEVEKTGPHRADIRTVALHPRTGARVHGVRIDLYTGKREIASFVAVRGEALFEQIAFGTYRLIIRDHRAALGTMRLSIKE
ncbi:MAG: hypothetical protein N3B18_07450 [Desulfobacterota bacterium]|nr:hypothetical protein [Thermodesulfobacteriota bacterium]